MLLMVEKLMMKMVEWLKPVSWGLEGVDGDDKPGASSDVGFVMVVSSELFSAETRCFLCG